MESSADHYSRFAGVDGYRIAAKSGTAEVPGADGKLSSIISDWAGIIPADNPRFVITVVMKDPKVGGFGGLTAGPVFKSIGEFLMQKYQVPTSAPRTDAIAVQW
jgi:cell division protein FtsI (penicillin-binding protein 3)